MLQSMGLKSIEELIDNTIPASIRLQKDLPLDPPLQEHEYLRRLKTIAKKNKPFRSMIGMGYYGTACLPVVLRNIFENPGWYTSYTPYQAEISQGRLEALFNFQTMICSLTGFDLANCSLLDEATAAAEALRMMYELRSRQAVKEGRDTLFVDEDIFPQTLSVMRTRAANLNIRIETGCYRSFVPGPRLFGIMVQYPSASGQIRDYRALADTAHRHGIMVCAACDLLSLAVLKEPAAWGADIATGSAQRFGIALGFGGPGAAYMACNETYRRNMPGRIVGLSVDRLGKPAYRLALQTREQHIKRERATSNICTSEALIATMAGMFAVYHGASGIKEIACNCIKRAHAFASVLKEAGYRLKNEDFFDTIEIVGLQDTLSIRAKAEAEGINFYYPAPDTVHISFDELSDGAEAAALMRIFELPAALYPEGPALEALKTLPEGFTRSSDALTESIFNTYHSEMEMTRYIKRLENKDVSLVHSMTPLGSCTMKLNAAVEMMPLSWPEFTDVHPFAPVEQAAGYMQIIRELSHDLCVITGMQACSFQPVSGAAGEYAGLSVIRAYHRAMGHPERNRVIIPASAHGTNPASAAMAGLQIVCVGNDANGNIDVEELRRKAEENRDCLSCMMITYPSTHGVFEAKIKEIVAIIHENGGLLYMDGANLNAQVGLTNPGYIGADVCHLNLHKTFAMPHGGGGPGMGPICVTAALAPYLPGHPIVNPHLAPDADNTMTAVGAAPFGSSLLLPITHAYIKLLGAQGLRQTGETAILNANYLSHRLAPRFQTLYKGATGFVAHECIIDLRHFAKEYGVDANDFAKRLMDFGFHAPTLSFPVHETLMIEPTESESLSELDRFIDAMNGILDECEAIKAGKLDPVDNPLKMAPHTAAEVCSDHWEHAYPRSMAAYPKEWVVSRKFWPSVSRVDNGYGDRHLVCRCE